MNDSVSQSVSVPRPSIGRMVGRRSRSVSVSHNVLKSGELDFHAPIIRAIGFFFKNGDFRIDIFCVIPFDVLYIFLGVRKSIIIFIIFFVYVAHLYTRTRLVLLEAY